MSRASSKEKKWFSDIRRQRYKETWVRIFITFILPKNAVWNSKGIRTKQGNRLSCSSPWPNFPNAPAPQEYTSPSVVKINVKSPPQATCLTWQLIDVTAIGEGGLKFAIRYSSRPSAPQSPCPQVETPLASPATTAEWLQDKLTEAACPQIRVGLKWKLFSTTTLSADDVLLCWSNTECRPTSKTLSSSVWSIM